MERSNINAQELVDGCDEEITVLEQADINITKILRRKKNVYKSV